MINRLKNNPIYLIILYGIISATLTFLITLQNGPFIDSLLNEVASTNPDGIGILKNLAISFGVFISFFNPAYYILFTGFLFWFVILMLGQDITYKNCLLPVSWVYSISMVTFVIKVIYNSFLGSTSTLIDETVLGKETIIDMIRTHYGPFNILFFALVSYFLYKKFKINHYILIGFLTLNLNLAISYVFSLIL